MESAIEEIGQRQADLTKEQQTLHQEHQQWLDQQGVRRAQIEGGLRAMEPEKQSRFSALAAEEARLVNELQRLQREGSRDAIHWEMGPEERVEAEDRVQAENDQLATKRAEVEDEFAKRSASLQGDLSELEVEATRANVDLNGRDRELQRQLNDLSQMSASKARELERIRGALSVLIAEEAAAEAGSEAEAMASEKAREMEHELSRISGDRDRLAREVQELAPLVEAQRDATSAQGAENLGEFFSNSAKKHRASWMRWLFAFVVTVAIAVGVGLYTVNTVAPKSDADAREIFHAVAVALLVVGLLLYVVRIASLQFRVHRNLEAVDESKAAALRTYSRIVAAASSPDVRTALVSSLADAVFRTPETGLIDQSSDHNTLVERLAGSAASRASNSG